MHPLVDQLLALVPPSGAPWPRAARERWVTALGAVLDVVYEDGHLSPHPPERGRPEPEPEPEPEPAHLAWEAPAEQRTPTWEGAPETAPAGPGGESRPEEQQTHETWASPAEDERVLPPWYSTDWSVLDLTEGLPHEGSDSGRHVRRSTPYD